MKFGVTFGQRESIDQIAREAVLAENSGFDLVSFVDSQNRARDIYVMMTISALNTQRVLIGQMVTVPFIRHPSVTANATASVDEISNGRVFLGIGAGGSAVKSMGLETRPLRELEKVVRFF